MEKIDRDRRYQYGDYDFINFKNLSKEDLLLILQWRNSDSIRKWMYNSEHISEENHFKFVENLNNCIDKYYWAVYKDGKMLGVVNITDLDHDNSSAEIGYYLSPDFDGIALDAIFSMCGFLIDTLKVKYLRACTMVDNQPAMQLDIYLGFEYIDACVKVCGCKECEFWNLVMTSNSFAKDIKTKNNLRNYMMYLRNAGRI